MTTTLTDRLVVAVDEQDVLFVLYWLNEMKEAGCLQDGIGGNREYFSHFFEKSNDELIRSREADLWKGYSAITSIARNPPSPFRKIMLQILLLQGIQIEVVEIVQLGMMCSANLVSSAVVDMLFKWETCEKENGKTSLSEILRNALTTLPLTAKYAKLLVSLPLEQAAHWLDRILPPAPNASEFTGYSPPRPPPSPISYVSVSSDCDDLDLSIPVEVPERTSTAVYQLHPILFPRKPVPELDTPRFYYSSQAQSYWIYPHPPPGFELVQNPAKSGIQLRPLPSTLVRFPSQSHTSSNHFLIDPVHLGLARFPQNFTPFDLASLFHGNGVRCKIVLLQASTSETYAVVKVEDDMVERCLKCLDGIKLEEGSRRFRCFVVEMEGTEELEDATTIRQWEWTGQIDEGLVPFPPSVSSPAPTSVPTLTSTSTSTVLARKDLSAYQKPSRRRRDPPRPPQPTSVLVLNLPLNVNDEPFKRFNPQSMKLLRYDDRKRAFAILSFRGKNGAQRFMKCWNTEEKKQPYERSQAEILPTDVEHEEFTKRWFESLEGEGERRKRHRRTEPIRMSALKNKKRKLEESFPSFTFDHELFISYDECDYPKFPSAAALDSASEEEEDTKDWNLGGK